jgi:hypothetical protein
MFIIIILCLLFRIKNRLETEKNILDEFIINEEVQSIHALRHLLIRYLCSVICAHIIIRRTNQWKLSLIIIFIRHWKILHKTRNDPIYSILLTMSLMSCFVFFFFVCISIWILTNAISIYDKWKKKRTNDYRLCVRQRWRDIIAMCWL